MSEIEDTPSIVNREITSFRGGQSLGYADLTAGEKRDYLFEAGIRATAYSGAPGRSLPDIHFGLVEFADSAAESYAHQLLRETITRVGDELDPPKRKLFHTFGATAKVRFEPLADTPYSGIFGETALGLLRISYAGPVVGVGIVPGLGLKVLVDGDHPSENLVAMRMLDPQWTPSVFHNAFTNILPSPGLVNVVMHTVQERFESVVADGRGLHQPVDNFARVHTSGLPVEGEPRAPYRLILVPTDTVRRASDPRLDFREDLARNVAVGTTIYTVLGLDEAEDDGSSDVDELIPRARRIGALRTDSEFIASAYGDYRLFFKHNATYLRP
jgi:hypothetical protein